MQFIAINLMVAEKLGLKQQFGSIEDRIPVYPGDGVWFVWNQTGDGVHLEMKTFGPIERHPSMQHVHSRSIDNLRVPLISRTIAFAHA